MKSYIGQTLTLYLLFFAAISMKPNLLFAQGDDVYWDSRFNQLGVNGTILAIAVNGTDVYVGGSFDSTGNIKANKIAKWDGSSWSALGTGISGGNVDAIALSGGNVYVGGDFTSAGGISVNSIAKWDGNNWSALDSGISGDVRAIATSGTDVYVGGFFYAAGGVSVNNIAMWNGSIWSKLGTDANNGVNSVANAITVDGSNVYVGGNFTAAGGINTDNIATWDGNTWSSMGSGITGGDVNAIAVLGNDVYAGGIFNTAGGIIANKIAKWDGNNWSAIGNGISGGNVNALAIFDNSMYIGGSFTTAGALSVNKIARWNGSNWSSLGSGIDGGPIFALGINSAPDIFVGGSFTTAGGKISEKIALWNKLSSSVPVELISFTAYPNGEHVDLRWETATETNNYGFDLERMLAATPGLLNEIKPTESLFQQGWEKIAFISGNGTSSMPHIYKYSDQVKKFSVLTKFTVSYRLKQIDLDGTYKFYDPIKVYFGSGPETIKLGQNYPNPFNPETSIEFSIPKNNFTTLKVYNINGQEIRTLIEKQLEAGIIYKIKFNAGLLSSGIYYYSLQSGDYVITKKMSILK